MKNKYKKLTFIFISTTILFCGLSLFNFYLYYHESNKLKNTVLPVTDNDYFSLQTSKVKFDKMLNKTYELDLNTYKWDKYAYQAKNGKSSWKVDTPIINQNINLPNVCEIVAATMLLNYYGFNISSIDLSKGYLLKKEVYVKDGKLYGPNPALYYAGDPTSKTNGWGVFAPAIVKAINNYLLDQEENGLYYNASELGHALNILAMYQKPVIIWISTNYEPIEKLSVWNSYDGKSSYYYPNKSHTVLLVGEDEDYYYINDSLKPTEVQKVVKEKLEAAFDSNGRQAIMM